jgi:hypothetical protein
MKFKLFCSMIVAAASMISLSVSANNDPLLGQWKTIDDRTGYSLADVIISKDAKDRYMAKIVNVREVPGGGSTTKLYSMHRLSQGSASGWTDHA